MLQFKEWNFQQVVTDSTYNAGSQQAGKGDYYLVAITKEC